MRSVKVYKHAHKLEDGKSFWEKIDDGYALFHQFSIDYEEFESGIGNYSSAIIERENGKVESVSVDMIQFITKGDSND